MKIVFVSYNNQSAYSAPELWLERIKTFVALLEALAEKCEVSYIKQIGYEGNFTKNNVGYIFLRSNKKKSYLPRRINHSIKNLDPDVVIVSGIRSPLQIIQLRLNIGQNTIIIGRHHAERPPKAIRRLLQQLADKCINAYLFTSTGNAQEWFDAGIIGHGKEIYELIEASTGLTRLEKERSLQQTEMNGDPVFLWVGRLNVNKDPLTVLKGFEKYLVSNPVGRLYMIFGGEDLLHEVNDLIEQSPVLSGAVILKGQIANNELSAWYSAADFYISASHSEGGSYALLEAMACGCIPIVTAIPAALKVIGDGRYGVIFQPGDVNDLAKKLAGLSAIDQKPLSKAIEYYFNAELSSRAIAAKLYGYCIELLSK